MKRNGGENGVATTYIHMHTCHTHTSIHYIHRCQEPSWSMAALTQAAKDAKEKGIKTVLGYEATFHKFIDDMYPGRFSGVIAFQRARAGYSKLHASNTLDDFIRWAQSSVMWLDKRMSSTVVYSCITESFKHFERNAPDLSGPYSPLLVRFACVSVGASSVPFLFKEIDDLKIISRIFLVLGDDDKQLSKQRGYAATYSPPDGTPRPTLFLDEMNRVLTTCLSNLSDDAIDWCVHDQMVNTYIQTNIHTDYTYIHTCINACCRLLCPCSTC